MSDRYGAHKYCEKYWVMEIEWWCQTGVVFKVMSDEWRKLSDEKKKQTKQGPNLCVKFFFIFYFFIFYFFIFYFFIL